MIKKLEKIFEFLARNHEFNREIQHSYVKQALSSCDSPRDRMRLLLERAVNSQSMPRLDQIAEFWKLAHEKKESLDSYQGFSRLAQRENYPNLVMALSMQNGWGNKTASLFVRNLYLAQNDDQLRKLIWPDVDINGERIYLSVDSVIKNIFSRIDELRRWEFVSINKILEKIHCTPDAMLVWDDLWFWGFITQYGSASREFVKWNEAKYWSIFTAPKDVASITKIKRLAKEFYSLTEPM